MLMMHWSSIFLQRPVTLVSPEDDSNSGPVPLLPEKRKSYASTASSRASSVFSDSVPDPTCPLSPFSSSNSPGNSTQNPFSLDPGGSSVPSGSSVSTLSPTTPRQGVLASDGYISSGTNGYSYVTPPSTPIYSSSSVASWVSESTNYFSTSSFNSELMSPGSPPKQGFDTGTQPPSSTPHNFDFLAETSPAKNDSTPPLLPSKGHENSSTSMQKVGSWSYSETTSTITSSANVGSREESAKPRTPVPAPRRNTLTSSNRPTVSRTVFDASDELGQEVTPPPVMPRKSLHFPADNRPKSPPAKPPRPSQSANRLPPPIPKPYASKLAGNSPSAQRETLNTDTQDMPPSEGQQT